MKTFKTEVQLSFGKKSDFTVKTGNRSIILFIEGWNCFFIERDELLRKLDHFKLKYVGSCKSFKNYLLISK
jgi:hypothetical protein